MTFYINMVKAPKISGSLRSFITHFQPKQAVIITQSYAQQTIIDLTELFYSV